MGESEDRPLPPSLPWRIGSTAVMAFIGSLSRAFMHGANTQETHGLNAFLDLVDERADVSKRRRGLLTGTLS